MTHKSIPRIKIGPCSDQTRDRLAKFIENNPSSKLSTILVDDSESGALIIDKPWDDDSVGFFSSPDDDALIQALNKVSMPRLLSAIHHTESRLLEIIWTAYELPDKADEITERSFSFCFKGKVHECYFGIATPELMALAARIGFKTTSNTNFRNLQSFNALTSQTKEELGEDETRRGLDRPRCFFITNFDFDDDETIEFVQHLNFYMSYYDKMSPVVLLHIPLQVKDDLKFNRSVRGVFPKSINADMLDSNLLTFWNANTDLNPMMDYIVCYRIIEYASMHFVDEEMRVKFKRLLKSPRFGEDSAKDIEELAFISNARLEDSQRVKALIRRNVDPKILWPEIDAHRDVFSKDTCFDGGYVQKALVHTKDDKEQFCKHGFHNISDSLRKLRNALSHGKDLETAGVITPTLANYSRMRPFVHLINIVAGEIILYKDAT